MRTVPLQLAASSGKGASISYVCFDQLMGALLSANGLYGVWVSVWGAGGSLMLFLSM